VQQELGQVNQSLQVITNDQARLRANLREMPSTAAAYKRYLEKFDKQETEIEKLQEQQKKLQAGEHGARQEFEAYVNNLNVK
jgi:transcriptional regulator of NAD metabolism